MNAQTRNPALVQEFAAAEYLGISVSTLRRDRVQAVRTIPVINIGGAVRYSILALDAWIERSMLVNVTELPASRTIDQPALAVQTEKRRRGRPRKLV